MANEYIGWSDEEQFQFATNTMGGLRDLLAGGAAFIRDHLRNLLSALGAHPNFLDLILVNPAYDNIMDAKKDVAPAAQSYGLSKRTCTCADKSHGSCSCVAMATELYSKYLGSVDICSQV